MIINETKNNIIKYLKNNKINLRYKKISSFQGSILLLL